VKILVIDDEEAVRDLIREILEEMGNDCVCADSADAADEVLGHHAIDAVTLDLGMPGRGGLEWLEELYESHPELAQRTVVITGACLEADSVERLAACGAGIVAKPFTVESLFEIVRTQLRDDGKPN